jgi:hypothetical protein
MLPSLLFFTPFLAPRGGLAAILGGQTDRIFQNVKEREPHTSTNDFVGVL